MTQAQRKEKLLKQFECLRIAYEKNFKKLARCDRNSMKYLRIEKRLNKGNIKLQKELGRGS